MQFTGSHTRYVIQEACDGPMMGNINSYWLLKLPLESLIREISVIDLERLQVVLWTGSVHSIVGS